MLSLAGDASKTAFGLAAQLLHVGADASREFGMIGGFPGAGGALERRELALALQLVAGCLDEKLAAPALTYQVIDLGDKLLGDDDVGAASVHRSAHNEGPHSV